MKPIGSEVRLTYETRELVEVGDSIVTQTGRTYLVQVARRMRSSRSPHLWALRCIVAPAPPPVGRCHHLVWWKRGRRPQVVT